MDKSTEPQTTSDPRPQASGSQPPASGLRSPAPGSRPLAPEIEPFPPGTDYFTAMGLPRRLILDEAALEATFYDLSRRFHPDRFAGATPRVRIVSLENSALVNAAYRALRDPWERARYLVDLQAEGKVDVPSQPPSELFEDILELQETLVELRMGYVEGGDVEDLKALVVRAATPFREALAGLDARRDTLFQAWDSGDEAARASALAGLKALLGERRYLARVSEDVDAALEGHPASRGA